MTDEDVQEIMKQVYALATVIYAVANKNSSNE